MENKQVGELGQSSTKYPQLARMLAPRDYQLSKNMYENRKSVIYRGIREEDKLPVLVRLLKPEHPTHEELGLFLGNRPGICRYFGLFRSYYLVYIIGQFLAV